MLDNKIKTAGLLEIVLKKHINQIFYAFNVKSILLIKLYFDEIRISEKFLNNFLTILKMSSMQVFIVRCYL